ncbi:MAG: GNAT family N-acetyltransferase [Bdellovibrionales bacterium]|nr:GNAT family N-acetyltransferase [Bdellovibrionales bacterium]
MFFRSNAICPQSLQGLSDSRPDPGFSIITIQTEKELRSRWSQIMELYEHARDRNIFFEPWLLESVFTHQLSVCSMRIIATTRDDGALTGLYPIQTIRRFAPLLTAIPSLLRHSHCFLSHPILRIGKAEDSLRQFLRWQDQTYGRAAIEFRNIPDESECAKILRQFNEKRERLVYRYGSYYRPFHDLQGQRPWLQAPLRKEIGRKTRRLLEQRNVAVEVWNRSQPIHSWIDQFLELEVSGWKGRANSAILQNPDETAYFRSVIHKAAYCNRLIAVRLVARNVVIASRFSLTQDNVVYSYKTAYDEAFSHVSPGLLLEIENLNYLRSRHLYHGIDSCSEAHHPMFDRLYNSRTGLAHYLVSSATHRSKLFLSGFSFLRENLSKSRDRAS